MDDAEKPRGTFVRTFPACIKHYLLLTPPRIHLQKCQDCWPDGESFVVGQSRMSAQAQGSTSTGDVPIVESSAACGLLLGTLSNHFVGGLEPQLSVPGRSRLFVKSKAARLLSLGARPLVMINCPYSVRPSAKRSFHRYPRSARPNQPDHSDVASIDVWKCTKYDCLGSTMFRIDRTAAMCYNQLAAGSLLRD